MRRLALPVAIATALSLAVPATAAAPRPGAWKGAIRSHGSKVTFRVAHGRVLRWRAERAPVFCVSNGVGRLGVRTMFVRTAPVRRGRVRKRVAVRGGRLILTARFTSRTRVRGTIDYDVRGCGSKLGWSARRVR